MSKKFQLTVTTLAENPQLEHQRAEYEKSLKSNRTYYDNADKFSAPPDQWLIERVLEVTLTEAEYEYVKRAVLATYQ